MPQGHEGLTLVLKWSQGLSSPHPCEVAGGPQGWPLPSLGDSRNVLDNYYCG